jgi:hypothetical protein
VHQGTPQLVQPVKILDRSRLKGDADGENTSARASAKASAARLALAHGCPGCQQPASASAARALTAQGCPGCQQPGSASGRATALTAPAAIAAAKRVVENFISIMKRKCVDRSK